ncbi:MAG: hypothetical protein P0Y60_08980 [Candidatus Microbacterium colombiense]|nr:MAG: hypothetical protein P0Y60_08980 [Microbacterium sp.]
MTSRQTRLVRAFVVSAAATLIAAVSHTIGGGAAPHALLIVAVSVFITPVAALVIGDRRSRTRTALTVALTQGVFHAVFQLLGSPTSSTAGASGADSHTHHVALALLTPAAATGATAAPGAMMLGAHIVAAAITMLMVWHGDALLRSITEWMQALLRPRAVGAHPAHRRPPRLRSVDIQAHGIRLSAAVSRRGPPPLLRG